MYAYYVNEPYSSYVNVYPCELLYNILELMLFTRIMFFSGLFYHIAVFAYHRIKIKITIAKYAYKNLKIKRIKHF